MVKGGEAPADLGMAILAIGQSRAMGIFMVVADETFVAGPF